MEKSKYKQRREELLKSIISRYSSLSTNETVKHLNESYGLDIKVDGLEKAGGSVGFFYCLNLKGHYGRLHEGHPIMYRKGYEPAKLIANLLRGRDLSDEENKRLTQSEGVEEMLHEHTIPGTSRSLHYFPCLCDYAISTSQDFLDKVKERKLTKQEYETGLTNRITGGSGNGQSFIIGLLMKSKMNGSSYQVGSDVSNEYLAAGKQFQKKHGDKKPKPLTEKQWEAYKRRHLNPNPRKNFLEKICSYFHR